MSRTVIRKLSINQTARGPKTRQTAVKQMSTLNNHHHDRRWLSQFIWLVKIRVAAVMWLPPDLTPSTKQSPLTCSFKKETHAELEWVSARLRSDQYREKPRPTPGLKLRGEPTWWGASCRETRNKLTRPTESNWRVDPAVTRADVMSSWRRRHETAARGKRPETVLT